MPARIAATVETKMSRLPTCESSCAKTPVELVLVQAREGALRDGHRRVLGVAAGREGIDLHLGRHVDLRHRQARGDAKIFNDVIKLRVVFFFHRLRVRERERDLRGRIITDKRIHNTEDQCENDEARIAVRLRKNIADADHDHKKDREQKPCPADIRRLIRIQIRHALELYLHRLFLGVREVAEEFHLREAEHAREKIRREGLDLDIQVADHAVIEPAGGLDLVFGIGQLVL